MNEIRSIRAQVKWVTDRTKKKPYFEKIEKTAKALDEKLKSVAAFNRLVRELEVPAVILRGKERGVEG